MRWSGFPDPEMSIGDKGWWLAFLLLIVCIAPMLAPTHWQHNELNYFFLAEQFTSAEPIHPYSALFDDSLARSLSFGIIGALISVVGMESSLIILRFVAIIGLAAGFATCFRAWGVATVELIVAFCLFIFLGQNHFGGEWLILGVEAKIFAYIAILFALSCIPSGRWAAFVILSVLATYLHFLVGGFWAAAGLLLIILRDGRLVPGLKLLGLYVIGVLPMLGLLVYEQVVSPSPEVVDLDRSLNAIYSEFRNAHHVAPYVNVEHFSVWLPGIFELLAFLLVLYGLFTVSTKDNRAFVTWVLLLNVYLLVALVLAFVDRQSHVLAPLYLFRPSSLILLMSLVVFVTWLFGALPARGQRAGAGVSVLVAAALVIAVTGTDYAKLAYRAADGDLRPSINLFDTADEAAMIDWLQTNTEQDDIIVAEPVPAYRNDRKWIAFERVIGRPTVVAYKFVPTSKHDLAQWYRRLRWSQELFKGSCDRVGEVPVTYLVAMTATGIDSVADCSTVVYSNSSFTIVRVDDSAGSELSKRADPMCPEEGCRLQPG